MAAIVSPQFHCTGAGCPTLSLPTAAGTVTFVVSDYIENVFGIKYADRWNNVGYLAIFVAGISVLAVLSLRFISWIRR